jgi:hypothetical protein
VRVTTDAVGGDVGTRCELRARAAPAIVAARGVEAVVHPDHGRGRREWGAHVENQPVEKTKLLFGAPALCLTLCPCQIREKLARFNLDGQACVIVWAAEQEA